MNRLTFCFILLFFEASLFPNDQIISHPGAVEPDSCQTIPLESFALSKESKARSGDQETALYNMVKALQCERVREIVGDWKNRFPDDKGLQVFRGLSLADCLCAKHLSANPGEEAIKELRGATVILEETVELALQEPQSTPGIVASIETVVAQFMNALAFVSRSIPRRLAIYHSLYSSQAAGLLLIFLLHLLSAR